MKSIAVLTCLLASALCFSGRAVGAEKPRRAEVVQDRPADAGTRTKEATVFVSGQEGYHTFRIPSVIVTAKGTLLAFCEGRRGGRGDSGNIDLVMKRSTDGGDTWSKMQVIWDDAGNVCGNPCPVIDRKTGTIWMLLTWNLGTDHEGRIMQAKSKDTRRVFVTRSTDDGLTWAKPADITDAAKKPHWRWYATGPGVGIQLAGGRMLIPCDTSIHNEPPKHPYRSLAVYSDDHGKTWKLGGVLGEKTNECQAVELADGSVLMNMRSYHGKHCRAVATSTDGGLTWSKVTLDKALPGPVCQASALRYTKQPGFAKNRILYSGPGGRGRDHMTVRLSYDEGKTWPVAKVLYAGGAAYSCLTVLPDMTVGCLYEKDGYRKIVFARFSLGWLTDGKDQLKPKK